jgi:hypothetical protein
VVPVAPVVRVALENRMVLAVQVVPDPQAHVPQAGPACRHPGQAVVVQAAARIALALANLRRAEAEVLSVEGAVLPPEQPAPGVAAVWEPVAVVVVGEGDGDEHA